MASPATPAALRLESASDTDFDWLLGETPPSLAYRIAPDLASPDILRIIRNLPAHWLMVAGNEIVGIISIKAEGEGKAEIGYGVASSHQGRGFASAAVAALLPVLADRGIVAVMAETAPDNPASQRVLTNNGFVATGERCDEEDGMLIVWRADLAAKGENTGG